MKILILLLTFMIFIGCGEENTSLESGEAAKKEKLAELLTDSSVKKDNKSLQKVIYDLNLSTSMPNSITISWESSDTSLIDVNGSVKKSLGCGDSNQTVILTATLGQDGITVAKNFNVVVIKNPEKLFDELTIDDSIIFTASTQIDDLDINNSCGYAINWSTNSNDINISTTAIQVLQPVQFDNKNIEANATLYTEDYSYTKTFSFEIERKNGVLKSEVENILLLNDLNSTIIDSKYCEYLFDTTNLKIMKSCSTIESGTPILYNTSKWYYYSYDDDGTIKVFTDLSRNTLIAKIINISEEEFRIVYENEAYQLDADIATNLKLDLTTALR